MPKSITMMSGIFMALLLLCVVPEKGTSQATEEPLFLITNDDGYEHEYLAILARCMSSEGNIIVVAPHENMGGSSNRLTDVEKAVHVHRQDSVGEIPVFSVDATPTIVVRWGVQYVDSTYGEKPDMIFSGINPGANVGFSVYYSGTIGAAREGALMGIPSMAVSIRRNEPDLPGACEVLKTMAGHILESKTETKLFNVNFPGGTLNAGTPVKQTVVDMSGARLDYQPLEYPGSGRIYFFPIMRLVRNEAPGSDVYEVMNGAVSITPLLIDMTTEERLEFVEECE